MGQSCLDPWIQDLFYGNNPAFVAGLMLARLELGHAGVMRDLQIGRMAVGEQGRVKHKVMRPGTPTCRR